MWLIVGLGNPGSKYTFTRHNVGFLCVEHCLERMKGAGASFSEKSEHQSRTWKTRTNNGEILFVEPQTFMNLSGQAVQALMAFYKISLDKILVIQDDLDLAFGRIKFLKNRGAGGHNGIKSVSEMIGPDYARLKIGVGGIRHPGQEGGDYVLEKFTKEEVAALPPIFDKCNLAISSFIENGYERTANVYNQRDKDPDETEKTLEKNQVAPPKKKEDS